MAPDPLLKLRALCLALPEAHEKKAWGAPTFRVRDKLFAMYAAAGNHHGAGRPAVWINASKADQELMIRMKPERFFVPPYVGPNGWVGVWLDKRVSWKEVQGILEDGYRRTAPKRLLALLGADPGV